MPRHFALLRGATLRLAAVLLALSTAAAQAEAPMGDDGLHKAAWMQDTFKNMRDDLDEANAEGKRLLIMIEQRGCIYCEKMHKEVYPVPAIEELLTDKYFVVQINLFGGTEVTDFDGKVLTEKEMSRRWGIAFTPTLIFLPEEVPEGETATQAAVVTMPGAFGKNTVQALLEWVLAHGYADGTMFQEYYAPLTRGN